MDSAAILELNPVIQMREEYFAPLTHRGFKQNSALIGQAFSENRMFEYCGQ